MVPIIVEDIEGQPVNRLVDHFMRRGTIAVSPLYDRALEAESRWMTDEYKTRVSLSWADNEDGVARFSWLSITLRHGVGRLGVG